MTIKAEYDFKDVEKLLGQLKTMDRKQAMRDAAQIVLNSTKLGYTRKIDPELKPWAENPPWYKEMKGNAARLSGPITKKIQKGRFKNWEFVKVNTTRMANELKKRVTEDSATVYYSEKAKERANITQFGGMSKMEIKKDKKKIEFNINVRPRIHLGISDKYSRIPGGSDIYFIELAILKMIDEKLK